MSFGINLVQNCDHKILTRTQKITEASITMKKGYRKGIISYAFLNSLMVTLEDTLGYLTSNKGIDYIDDLPNVLYIKELYTLTDDVKKVISPEIYNLYNNAIIWLPFPEDLTLDDSHTPPALGELYYIDCKYYDVDYDVYNSNDCPRCSSRGWFIDFAKENSDASKLSGPYMVVQEFLQALLTTSGSDRLHDTYGAGLFSEDVRYLNATVMEDVRKCVVTAEAQCKALQTIDLNRYDDERLSSASINDISIDTENLGVIINVTLLTVYGNKITLNIDTTI